MLKEREEIKSANITYEAFICGVEDCTIELFPANVTLLGVFKGKDVFRFETYNEETAAKLFLDEGFLADSSEEFHMNFPEIAKLGYRVSIKDPETDDVEVMSYNEWLEKGSPTRTMLIKPPKIFGAGRDSYITKERAEDIIKFLEKKKCER
jgi:hypothetical protein